MASGSFIGMDRFGIDVILPFEERVATVASLCERGHADQMVLSHDAACYNDWLAERPAPGDHPELALPAHHPRRVPALQQRGVTDDQIRQMLVDNPRTIFEHPIGAY